MDEEKEVRRKKLGKWGEERALNMLKTHGYHIIEQNYRCRIGEADIIALKAYEICFVEVKTRTGTDYGLPCQAVNAEKRRKLRRIAQYYLLTHPGLSHLNPRMDIVEVLWMPDGSYIRHQKAVF